MSDLKHPELLNLYGKDINDEGLVASEGLRTLQKLFLWRTKVSPQAVEALQTKTPGVVVHLGFELTKI